MSRRPAPAARAAGASLLGSRLPTAPSAMPARLLRLGLGPSGPQDRVRAAQGQAGGKVAEGRRHGQVPPSHLRHPTGGAVRVPLGPWRPRGLCPGRRHHPPEQGSLSSQGPLSPLCFAPELATHLARAPATRAPPSARPSRGARIARIGRHKCKTVRAGEGDEENGLSDLRYRLAFRVQRIATYVFRPLPL